MVSNAAGLVHLGQNTLQYKFDPYSTFLMLGKAQGALMQQGLCQSACEDRRGTSEQQDAFMRKQSVPAPTNDCRVADKARMRREKMKARKQQLEANTHKVAGEAQRRDACKKQEPVKVPADNQKIVCKEPQQEKTHTCNHVWKILPDQADANYSGTQPQQKKEMGSEAQLQKKKRMGSEEAQQKKRKRTSSEEAKQRKTKRTDSEEAQQERRKRTSSEEAQRERRKRTSSEEAQQRKRKRTGSEAQKKKKKRTGSEAQKKKKKRTGSEAQKKKKKRTDSGDARQKKKRTNSGQTQDRLWKPTQAPRQQHRVPAPFGNSTGMGKPKP
ncbi:uncharacterized protein LOC134777179 [Penaeus indicus]|uniref:uncharacterized protein LOC134777179 n=1 Tax=Penaeus indicus TaxID=29960 RepID=UPI00300C659E